MRYRRIMCVWENKTAQAVNVMDEWIKSNGSILFNGNQDIISFLF